MTNRTPHSLLTNTRFYILATSILLSIAVAAYARLQLPSDQLYTIRLEQLFGLFCIVYWYVALAISPLGYVIGKQRTKRLEFARRAIGVSAAYFATLHTAVAFWGQLGGFGSVTLLPPLFKWSLAAGVVALFILLIMAATSFDKIVTFMTYGKWKWLHRLVYLGFILVVLHVWTIGTHLAYPAMQWVSLAALLTLSGLELYRTTKLVNKTYLHFDTTDTMTLFICLWIIVGSIIICLPLFVPNYHSNHTEHVAHYEGQGRHA